MLLDKLDDGIGSLLHLHALRKRVRLEVGDDALGDGDDLLGFFWGPHGCCELVFGGLGCVSMILLSVYSCHRGSGLVLYIEGGNQTKLN